LGRADALTVFVWVVLMNAMDFPFVDILATGLGAVGCNNWRIVPPPTSTPRSRLR
jgi:hypothetical protein